MTSGDESQRAAERRRRERWLTNSGSGDGFMSERRLMIWGVDDLVVRLLVLRALEAEKRKEMEPVRRGASARKGGREEGRRNAQVEKSHGIVCGSGEQKEQVSCLY